MKRAVTLAAVALSGATACGSPGERAIVPVATALATNVATSTTAVSTTLAVSGEDLIGAELLAAERGIRDASLSDEQHATFGVRQQRAYRALSGHPEWDAAVIAAAPEDVRPALEANIAARRAVTDHSATQPPSEKPATLPAWTIVEPLAVDVLRGLYAEAEATTGVPWAYLAAIHLVETRMGRLVGTSPDGAVGPMQFLPSTWADCCAGNVLDAHDAIVGAATYLTMLGAPQDMRRALFGYNPNDGYVGAVTAYAELLLADETALVGYHAWEVYVSSTAGSVRLPVGYSAPDPIDAAGYLAVHPQDSEATLLIPLG